MDETKFETTKAKFVHAAINAINVIGRPMAACEIEVYIRGKSWELLRNMPPDYAKIILNLETPRLFTKYKTTTPIRGVDRRAIFYGITGKSYTEDFVLFDPKSKREKPLTSSSSPSVVSSPNSPPNTNENLANNFTFFHDTTSDQAGSAWHFLTQNIPYNNNIWRELIKSIQTIDIAVSRNECSPTLVDTIIKKSKILSQPQYSPYVATILSREILIKTANQDN